MTLTDLAIPPWVRWAVLALAVAGVFGAGAKTGAWWQGKIDASEIAAAKLETANLRSSVSIEAAKQAQKAIDAANQQAKTTQEITHDSTTRARALDVRLAAGGMRKPASNGGSTCRLPAITGDSGASTGQPAQSVPAGAGRDPGSIQGGVADAVREDAARDAQQLAEVIDAAYRVGCAGR